MSTTLIPTPFVADNYTQAEEDTLGATLTGKRYGWALIFNTTLQVSRVWDGTVFINQPQIPPTLIFPPAVDFTTSAAVTGFSSTTINLAKRIKIGNLCTIYVNFSGVSNSTSMTFTLPFAAANFGQNQVFSASGITDNSIPLTLPGRLSLIDNSTLCRCYTDLISTPWTNSNTKSILSSFVYFTV